jgi:ribonuclease E
LVGLSEPGASPELALAPSPLGPVPAAPPAAGSGSEAPAVSLEAAAPSAPSRPRRWRKQAGGSGGNEEAAAGVAAGEAPPGQAALVLVPGEGAGEAGRRRTRRTRRPARERQPLPAARPKTMLITVAATRTQIAVLEEGELVEHYVASQDDHSIVGNIYLGRVQNVLPGMEAAFINIGEERNAVLYAGEVTFDEEVEGVSRRIEKVLKSGQPILAQVTKDPIGAKGARLSTEISIAGRYVVLVPDTESLGVSRRLPDDERTRLRDIAQRLRPAGYGLIVRTAARDADESQIAVDIERLLATWQEISEKAKQVSTPPALIHAEPELALRVVRDLLTQDVEHLITDHEQVFREIQDYVADVAPALAERMELYREEQPLFQRYSVVEQLRKGLERKVGLPSGGHLVIERTEALTVIDVNTGRFVGRSNLEDTVLRTNLEAAVEIAKQLRLRDIGGIIVIDFIDMLMERHRDELVREFRAALARDKTRTQVYPVSDLGLVQMTRKRISEGLLEAFSELCDKCGGRGIILLDVEH